MADPLADLDNLLNELDRSASAPPKATSPPPNRAQTATNTVNKIPAPAPQVQPAAPPAQSSNNDSWKNELEDLLSELSVAAPSTSTQKPAPAASTSVSAAPTPRPAAQQTPPAAAPAPTPVSNVPVARTIVSAPAPTYTATEVSQITFTSGGPIVQLSPEEEGLVRELNMARSNPHAYAAILESERKPYFDGKNLKLPGSNVILVTEEGAAAVDEAIRFLRSTNPLPPFNVSSAMAKAAHEAISEVGPTGETSCESIKRFEQYGRFEQEAVEIASFGTADPREIVVRFLVCDGQPDRVQRTYVFEPIYQCIGLAIGEHKSAYKTMACINFTKMFHAK
jgi:uncharacterized protein YkwD